MVDLGEWFGDPLEQVDPMIAFFGPPISVYTRAQVIEDGVLVDVSEMAREAGFKWPVAVTQRLWDEVITPDPKSVPYGQGIEGRLWDVLNVLHWKAGSGGSEIRFTVSFIMGRAQRRNIVLKAVVSGESPDGGPCITIMFPEED